MKKSLVFKILRLVISAGLLIFLITRLDIGRVAGHMRGMAPLPILVAVGLDFLMIVTNSVRWKILLKAKGMGLSVGRLMYYYLVGIFFSAFLPTSVGGDVARVVAVSAATGRRADSFASVIVERLLGFSVLFPIVLISLPFVAHQLREWRLVLMVEAIGIGLFAGMLILLLPPVARRVSHFLDPVFALLKRFRVRERLEKAYEAIIIYNDSRGALYTGLALSVGSRLLWVCGCYAISKAFALDLSFASLLLIVPVVELLRMIPISISGVGIREVAFVVMLRQFGVEDNLGFAFSLVVYIVFFLFSLAGGVLYGTSQFFRRSSGQPS